MKAMHLKVFLWVLLLITRNSICCTDEPPEAVDRYHHGVAIPDRFRWLERTQSAAVKEWVEHENQETSRYLRSLPHFAGLQQQLDSLDFSESPYFEDFQFHNGRLCACRDGVLVVLHSTERADPLREILDPEGFLPDHVADIDFYELSPDGKYIAACVSLDRTEDGSTYVFRTSDGVRIDDVIPRVSGPPGGDLKWKHDSSGFYYTRYPFADATAVDDRWRYSCEEIWFHQLGTDSQQDTYVAGDRFHRFPQCLLMASPYDDRLIIQVGYGAGAAGQTYFLLQEGGIELLLSPAAAATTVDFSTPGTLLVDSCHSAPRGKLLTREIASQGSEECREFFPEQSSILSNWAIGKKHVFTTHFSAEGNETLRVLEKSTGDVVATLASPPYSATTELCVLENDQLLFRTESYLAPEKWSVYDPETKQVRESAFSARSGVPFDDIRVVREWATAADGAKIPLTILCAAGLEREGSHPTLVSVYGGSKIRETPYFDEIRRVWFDLGGIWVFAHPRGEGELDENNFRATLNGNKHVTRDDTIACLEHLIERKYTNPARLALTGGSHGGLIAAMVMTHRPDLVAAVSIDVGDFCVLQNERAVFGPHLKLEYGDTAHRTEFERMVNYSPFQQLKPGMDYPAAWLRTGYLDRRVLPWNTWKMAARLREVDRQGPILVTTVMDEGHDYPVLPEEELAFLLSALKIPVKNGE